MKALKFFGISLFSLLGVLYLAFLFVLPNVINLNNYKGEINKIVKETANLEFDADNIKLATSWNLHTNIIIEKAKIKYPNKKELLSTERGKFGIKLLPLALLKIELAPIEFTAPNVNITIEKDGRYDIEKYLNEFLAKSQPAQQETNSTQALPIKISEKMPNILLSKYQIALIDEKNNNKMKIVGDEFKITEFRLGDQIKIETHGELFINDKKQIAYNAEIDSFLPKMEEAQPQTGAVSIPQITYNPLPALIKYNLGTNLNTKLKITESNKDLSIKGFFNATELNYKLQGQNLNQNFIKLTFDGNKIDIDSNLYVDKNEKFVIDGFFKNGKKQSINLHVNSNKIDLSDIQKVLIALADVANIKNDINQLKLTGYLDSNFTIKSDMKKIESDGYLKIANASINHSKLQLTITSIKSNLDFSNNKINIKDTSALINGSLFNVFGQIDTLANADIKVTADKLPLNLLYDAFAPVEMKKSIKLTSGLLNLNAIVKGKLDKIEPKVAVNLANLKIRETGTNLDLGLKSANVDLTANIKGEYKGSATADNFTIVLSNPYTKLSLPKATLGFDTQNITIKPATFYLDNSAITMQGQIKDYASKLNAVINADGKIVGADIKKYIPKDFQNMIAVKGSMPIVAQITSDGKNTQINGQLLATPQNYFSILNIDTIAGKSSVVNVSMDTDLSALKINDIGFYGLNKDIVLSKDFKNNLLSANKIATVSGKIGNLTGKNQSLQNIKITTPSTISASIPNFKNSKITAKSDILVNGTVNAPIIKGSLSIPNISIPDFMFNGKNINVDFTKDIINAKSPEIDLNGSKLSFDTAISTNFVPNTTINSLTINSQYIDVDKLLAIMENMPQSNVAPSASVPVIITKGQGTLAKVKSGNLVATNATGNFNLKNNLFTLSNLKATAYNGIVAGDVSYNIPYETVKAKVQGRGLDSNSAVTAVVGLKDQLQGKLDFDADISMIGMTYEQQMKTLKGSVDFSIGEGQMGSLGRLEHFIYASNLLSQKFAQSTLNSVIQTIAPKNTGKFQYLKGHLTFANGWAQLNPIHSGGPQMSLYMSGSFNLLNNYANIEILGRVAKEIVNVMGSIGDMSVSKMLSNLPKFGSSASNILSSYNAVKDEKTLAKVPQLVPQSADTKQFQVVIDGNIEKPSSIRTFKWLASEEEVKAAKAQMNTQIQNILPNKVKELIQNNAPAQNSSSVQTTAKPDLETVKQNASTALKEAAKNAAAEQLKKALPSFWDTIE